MPYKVVCRKCGDVTSIDELGEYPYTWQYLVCQKCGGAAVPDLESFFEEKKYPLEPGPCKFCEERGKTIYPTIVRNKEGEWKVYCRRCKTGVVTKLLVDALLGWSGPFKMRE